MDSLDNGLQEWLLKDDNESAVEDEDLPQSIGADVSKDIAEAFRTTVEKIGSVWMQMGLSSTEMMERIKEIKELHLRVDKNSLNTENSSLQRLIQYNDNKLKDINVILKDLTLPPFCAPNDRSLKQIGRILVYKHNELIELKTERLNQLTELKSKRDKLLKNMNAKAKEFKTATNIPSDEELMHLQTYVSDLTKERLKRFKKYQSLRKIIEHLFSELEREVETDFERHVLFEDEDNFILSDEHMKSLQSLHSELETSYQQNNDKRKLMEKRLESLWNKLEVEQSYRDIFFRNKNGCKPSVLALIEEEVVLYEELKRQNIELFIEKVRKDLEDWYQKCYTSDEQKDKFRPFMESNELNEELLEFHERELQRLQSYYEECEEMLEKLEEWHQSWDRYKELENKSNDPNRFNNRGGALLAEEREKNQIKKKLPKLENILKKFSEKREELKSEYFLIFGIPVKEYIENQKMEYQDMKENEKKERQRIKQMELNGQLRGKKLTPICGGAVIKRTPVKRTFTPISDAQNNGSNSKVRRIGGPLTPSRVHNDINTQTLTKRPNVAKGQPQPRPRARNLVAQMNQMMEMPGIEGSILSIDEDQFQAPLTDRDNANSTFISCSQRPVTPTRHITRRREPKPIHSANRRMSRSCNDLSEAISNKLHINGTRSTPASPHVKASYNCNSSRLPRIAVPQRKRPFLL